MHSDDNPVAKDRVIRVDVQTVLWMAGLSLHNGQHRILGGECVPDFSCCEPELLSTPVERATIGLSEIKSAVIEEMRRCEPLDTEEIDLETQEILVAAVDRWFENLVFDVEGKI